MLGRRLLLVTGKGGTGRSAVAASLALAAAGRGRAVLALAFDTGDGLAAHLGVGPLTPEVRRAGSLSVARVSPAAALDEYLRLRIAIPRSAGAGRVFAAIAETVPGVRDTVVIGKAIHEAVSGPWDLVVVDGPPTGQIGSYLQAPRTIAGLVPAGTVRRQATTMEIALADTRTSGLVIVSTPEELALAEATELRTEIASDPVIGVAATVANRVLPPAGFAEAAVRAEIDRHRRDAGALHLTMERTQQMVLEAYRPDVVLPWLFGVHTPDEVGARLAVRWEDS